MRAGSRPATASTIEPLVRLTARFHSRDIDLARLGRPLAMPETSLYTRDDGIVAGQTCCPELAKVERRSRCAAHTSPSAATRKP